MPSRELLTLIGELKNEPHMSRLRLSDSKSGLKSGRRRTRSINMVADRGSATTQPGGDKVKSAVLGSIPDTGSTARICMYACMHLLHHSHQFLTPLRARNADTCKE